MGKAIGFKNFANITNQRWFSTFLVLLRIGMGVQFLWAGLEKWGDWTAAGYLASATGPFAEFFQSLSGNALVDQLNIWGLSLIGVALILGVFVRPASFFGIIVMLLYYVAHFEQNTINGLVDSHIIYILVFMLFLAGGAGHLVGLDGVAYRHFRRSKLFKHLLFG